MSKVNKSFLKFLTDFGPLIVFFYFYYDSGKDLKIAIPPFIIATIIALGIMWFLEKKIPKVSKTKFPKENSPMILKSTAKILPPNAN